jgi:TPR repeat protein
MNVIRSARTCAYGVFAVLIGVGSASAQVPAPATQLPAGATPGAAAPLSPLATSAAKAVVITPTDLELINAEAQFRAHNYNPAYLQLLPHAHRGEPRAQYLLGQMADNGLGPVQLDVKEAANWYRLAAEKNHAEAQFALSNAYAIGRGVPVDPARSLTWLERAGQNGHVQAMLALAGLYESGLGAAGSDPAQAAEWTRRAAEAGSVDALNLMAQRLESGIGVEKNEAQAELWYRRAAARGQPAAQLWLGFRSGDGLNSTAAVNTESYMWLTLASQRGEGALRTLAAQQRRALQQNMMPSDVNEATTRARAWKPAPQYPGLKPDPGYDLPGGLNVPAQAKAPAAAPKRGG